MRLHVLRISRVADFDARHGPLRWANTQLRLGGRGIRAYTTRSYPALQVCVRHGSQLRSMPDRLAYENQPPLLLPQF